MKSFSRGRLPRLTALIVLATLPACGGGTFGTGIDPKPNGAQMFVEPWSEELRMKEESEKNDTNECAEEAGKRGNCQK